MGSIYVKTKNGTTKVASSAIHGIRLDVIKKEEILNFEELMDFVDKYVEEQDLKKDEKTMKDYLVTSDYSQWNNMWIVLAKDAKDAIEQVYQEYVLPMNEDLKEENKEVGYKMYRLCRKDELHAKSIGSLHNSDGKIICVN